MMKERVACDTIHAANNGGTLFLEKPYEIYIVLVQNVPQGTKILYLFSLSA